MVLRNQTDAWNAVLADIFALADLALHLDQRQDDPDYPARAQGNLGEEHRAGMGDADSVLCRIHRGDAVDSAPARRSNLNVEFMRRRVSAAN